MIEQRVVKRIHCREMVHPVLGKILDQVRNVTWIGDEDALPAGAYAQQETAGQREDVIERQCCHDGQAIDLRLLLQHRLQPTRRSAAGWQLRCDATALRPWARPWSRRYIARTPDRRARAEARSEACSCRPRAPH